MAGAQEAGEAARGRPLASRGPPWATVVHHLPALGLSFQGAITPVKVVFRQLREPAAVAARLVARVEHLEAARVA